MQLVIDVGVAVACGGGLVSTAAAYLLGRKHGVQLRSVQPSGRRSEASVLDASHHEATVAYPARAIGPEQSLVKSAPPIHPKRILIGDNQERPVVVIQETFSSKEFKLARPLSMSSGAVSRLSSLLQAVPSLMTANLAADRRLMEVVVDGALTRAADGNGFRAFVMGEKGIQSQARLFESGNLQNLVNAAAVWNIASVLLAQKHLADIQRSLEDLKAGISNISLFLSEQRRARISSTYDYLAQAHAAISAGEMPQSVRVQLESCERDLLEIQTHLELEFRRKASEPAKSTEKFGTQELMQNIGVKLDELQSLSADMIACHKTRVAAWHVLSLYPGEPHLKQARYRQLQESAGRLTSLSAEVERNTQGDIDGMSSFFNKAETLESRKSELRAHAKKVMVLCDERAQQGQHVIHASQALLLKHDKPTKLLCVFDKGKLAAVRETVALN